MVKRIASFEVVGFVLLAACGAVCQDRQFQSLPDAPSALAATQAVTQVQRFGGFAEAARSPLIFSATGAPGFTRQDGFFLSDRTASRHKDPDAIFRKYLSSSSLSGKRQPGYQSAGGGNLMGRATHAASHSVVTRDESGKGRLNTSYLLRALTSVAKDTASTPYWRRSAGAPLSNFGSTMGNDAGRNLWHEFSPGIARLAKNHTPLFISKIEERIGRR
jgi:hypothetical protein